MDQRISDVFSGQEDNYILPFLWMHDGHRAELPMLVQQVADSGVKEAFVSVVNQLITDREEILEELRTVRATLSGTEELETRQKQLAEQMNVDADAVQEIIAENARVAQDQEAYNLRYDALVSRFEATKAEYEKVSGEITQRGIRRREFGRFISSVEELGDKPIRSFDEALWGSLVDHLTVNAKDDIVFTMSNGIEIKA